MVWLGCIETRNDMHYLALHRHNFITFAVDREQCEAEAEDALRERYLDQHQRNIELTWLDISPATDAAVECAVNNQLDEIDLREDGVYDLITNNG